MKKLLLLLALAATLAIPGTAPAQSDDEVEARRVAQDLAGAFSNDGFKLKDGHWTGPVEPQKPAVIQVNLFAGNQYWFSVGASAKAKRMAVALFDEKGRPVETESLDDGPRAAAGFSPEVSGPFFVRIQMVEGDPAAACLIYSYK